MSQAVRDLWPLRSASGEPGSDDGAKSSAHALASPFREQANQEVTRTGESPGSLALSSQAREQPVDVAANGALGVEKLDAHARGVAHAAHPGDPPLEAK